MYYIDYMELNKFITRIKYLLSYMVIHLINCKEHKSFSKIDLRSEHHHHKIKHKDISKTAFSTRYGY